MIISICLDVWYSSCIIPDRIVYVINNRHINSCRDLLLRNNVFMVWSFIPFGSGVGQLCVYAIFLQSRVTTNFLQSVLFETLKVVCC